MNTNEKRKEVIEMIEKIGFKATNENTVLNSENQEVCNLIPIVNSQRIEDGKHKLLISGIGSNNELLPSVLLDITTIQKKLWVTEYYGFAYYINKKRLDDFMTIIRHLCSKSSTKRVYNHTGLIQEDNKWYYAHANGCIGGIDADVELDESIDNYYLPDKITNLHDACNHSLKL